jgi:hypothetical protein
MSNDSERLKILEMIDSGVITPSQGIELLKALEDEPEEISAGGFSEPSDEPARLYAQAPVSQADQASESIFEDNPLPIGAQSTAEQAYQSDSEAVEVEDAPEEAPGGDAPPNLDPEIAKWRRWWWIPMTIGVSITVMSAALMYWTWLAGGFSFWFACAWFPFLLGILVIALSGGSRSARWLHVRVHLKQGERPRTIAISLPLPLRLTAWFFKVFGRYLPTEVTGLDEVILALEKVTPDTPFYVKVDDEDGEQVEVYIG